MKYISILILFFSVSYIHSQINITDLVDKAKKDILNLSDSKSKNEYLKVLKKSDIYNNKMKKELSKNNLGFYDSKRINDFIRVSFNNQLIFIKLSYFFDCFEADKKSAKLYYQISIHNIDNRYTRQVAAERLKLLFEGNLISSRKYQHYIKLSTKK